MSQSTALLYETDFYAWTHTQASRLREEEFAELDLPNLIEELEAMGRRERRELISRLTVLLTHLLKWQLQSDLRSKSWRNTINHQREEIELLLDDSPSLRRELDEWIGIAFPRACLKAQRKTGLLASIFPETVPFTTAQLLDATFLPA